jgi:pimeloyl-ACP methyl ester carboxylesterase
VIVRRGDAEIHVTVRGEGPSVVLIASLGRGAADFDDLGSRLASAGFRAAAIDPRGVGESTGTLDGLTLHDLADDVAAVIDAVGAPAHLVGHAFGQRVARCTAADHPDKVKTVTALASGGLVEPSEDVRRSLFSCFDMNLTAEERLEHARRAFFAEGNDPSPFQDGWWPAAARSQGAAVRATPREDWWLAGSAPLLIIQGLEDVTAPPENGRLLADEAGSRATLVELEHAGHALLPERPDSIADHVISFISSAG